MIKARDRISPRYVDLQRELHARPDGFGGKGYKWTDPVVAIIQRYQATSVLDYGCGRGTLNEELRSKFNGAGVRFADYDPAISGKDSMPDFADLVICTDVLEHVEPEYIENVLKHINQLARRAVFFVIALTEANKTLEDGRNAHLIIETAEWWNRKIINAGFQLVSAADLPYPRKYKPDVQAQKRLIVIGVPC